MTRSGGRGGSVTLRGVTRRFGDFTAVDRLDLEVEAGSFVSILGPSGSGKTTTMRMIGGFELPDEGTVEIAGVDVTDLPPHRRNVNTVFQRYGLFPHMTVQDNVAYGLRMKRVRREERRRRALEMLEIVRLPQAAALRPGQLSGGMMQRVALARALVNRPSVLLLDEPLGALDRKLREEMQVELRRLQATFGTTFVYVTHDQDEALSMSDRLVVMRDGRIVQEGLPGAVYDEPATLWVAEFVGASNRIAGIVGATGAGGGELESDGVRVAAVWCHDGLVAGQRAVAVVRPESVRVAGPHDDDAAGAGAVNRVHAVLDELLTVGAQTRAVALTPGGLQVTAQLASGEAGALALTPGDRVALTWDVSAVRVYPSEVIA